MSSKYAAAPSTPVNVVSMISWIIAGATLLQRVTLEAAETSTETK